MSHGITTTTPTTTIVASHHDLCGYSCQHQRGQRQQRQRRTTTTAAAAAWQLPMLMEEEEHRQQLDSPFEGNNKQARGRAYKVHPQCFYVCFLLTSYYRRRGIPSISMPGALSPSFTPISTPRPSLPLDHSHFDVVKRVIPSSSRRNNDKQLEARGRAYKVRPQCFLRLFFY